MREWFRPVVAALAVVLGVGGTTLISVGLAPPPAETAPPIAYAVPATSAARAKPAVPAKSAVPPKQAAPPKRAVPTKAAAHIAPAVPAIHRSVPVRLAIPEIGLRTDLISVGLRPDGHLQTPPLRGDAPAGWYEGSPTPGETGSSVIVGHVDSAHDGPAVFYPLRLVHVGDRITVTRADGGTVAFAVTRIALYPKDDFPSQEVYGPGDEPALTLVTCGGSFDRTHGTYRSNLIVFSRALPPTAR
jgi:sortase (surface protein transpeptidase)